ncbi:MAG: transporter substrate-binding domain-containing protein [Ruminococcaceae bacterium]|nr:transporter substrate-binding domain-containing protein [Oscillospiraceae bacterium]
MPNRFFGVLGIFFPHGRIFSLRTVVFLFFPLDFDEKIPYYISCRVRRRAAAGKFLLCYNERRFDQIPMKKTVALLLIIVLCFSLCACGESENAAFRTLAALGTKQYAAICRGGDELAGAIDAALITLGKSGSISAISLRWLGKDRCTLSADAPAEAESAAISRPLIIGVEQEFIPMAYEDDGKLCGMSVELAEAIGTVLGCEIRLQLIAPDEVGAQLSSGNIDCALGFDPGSVKADKYHISPSYMESDIVLAVRPDSDVKRMKHLQGCRIGIINDPIVAAAVKNTENLTKYADGATQYLSAERCVSALDNGWCAAVAMDSIMLSFAAAQAAAR